ncbi:pirin family protein [Chitinophagaceae bacterium LB-8]|uniref:Pirin family protein n=1 Tax=Paraflavisolibacter caeni TaxID=2982496 RepID=A0A9X3BH18_9BACT|nr:pirin family protein [Paraflavisolibacter caeni]MCU7551814.1 pirin family protein [Paraflavisolibacter caeni]
MLQKINNTMFLGNGPIKILYPGRAISKTDTGIGSIGRIDHPEIHGNTVIAMHPHINDEILSYFRTGKAEHSDSEGFVKTIGRNTLMLMKAGRSFFHEEKIIGEGEPLEGLQIFIRPGKKDLQPEVIFHDLDSMHSENNWRLLASPDAETKFQFSSQTWLYDIKLLINSRIQLPKLPKNNLTCLLYVFKGNVKINEEIELNKKESLIIKNEDVMIGTLDKEAELVLFVTDESAEKFDGGMYSGNQL